MRVAVCGGQGACAINKEELTTILCGGPAIIRMNDGRFYEAPGLDSTLISDIAVSILHRGEDGKMRHVYLRGAASIRPDLLRREENSD